MKFQLTKRIYSPATGERLDGIQILDFEKSFKYQLLCVNQRNEFIIYFENCVGIQDEGYNTISSATGRSYETIDKAIDSYVEQIRGKTLAFDESGTGLKYEKFSMPVDLIHTMYIQKAKDFHIYENWSY